MEAHSGSVNLGCLNHNTRGFGGGGAVVNFYRGNKFDHNKQKKKFMVLSIWKPVEILHS